jgi:hypothetical protein
LTLSAVKSSVNYCATSWRDSTIIAPVSAYHRASYVYRYSRFRGHDNLDDALLHTLRYFEDTPISDTKTEQRLVRGALDETHDFLKLYAEVIKQPPPDDLELIEQVLRKRHESLEQLHPTQSPQP